MCGISAQLSPMPDSSGIQARGGGRLPVYMVLLFAVGRPVDSREAGGKLHPAAWP